MKSLIFAFLMIWGGGIAFFLRGMEGALSYEVAFLSFVAVFLSLYFPLRRKMIFQKESNGNKINERKDDEQESDEEDLKIPFSQKIFLGLGISFSVFRIFAYVFLILALIALLELKAFDVYVYMIGIFAGLFGILSVLFLELKRNA